MRDLHSLPGLAVAPAVTPAVGSPAAVTQVVSPASVQVVDGRLVVVRVPVPRP